MIDGILDAEVKTMNSTLTADPMAEPSAEEIARMQAEMQEWYAEAEKTFVRMDARQVEIDQLRAETHAILDSCEAMMRR